MTHCFFPRLVHLSLVSLALAGVVNAAAPTKQALPASNPYAAAIAAWEALPKEQRTRLHDASYAQVSPATRNLTDDTPPLPSLAQATATPETTAAVQAITQALRAGAQMPTVDWGIDMNQKPENIIFRHVGDMRRLSYIALAQADQLVATDPQAAITLAADTLAAARHAGTNNFLISRLVQSALDGIVTNWIARRLPDLPPDTVSELQRRIATLPDGGDWAACFQNEKRFPESMLDQILDLVALAPASESDLTARTLRMAGLLNDGKTVSISLETTDLNFWIQTGQTRHGVRLVSVDLKRHQALLSYEGRLVQLQLEGRKLVDLDTIHVTLPEDHPLRKMLEFLPGKHPEDLPQTLFQWVTVTQEIMDYYDALIASFDDFDFANSTALYERLSLAAKTLTMDMGSLQRTAAHEKIRSAQLTAVLAAAATGKPPADVIDPITQKPFRITPTTTSNGTGYIIESEFRPSPTRPTRLVIGPEPDKR